MTKTILFVCPHGAAKSRVAAALFNHHAPVGWQATSAGMAPGPELSPTAARLLAGTGAESELDGDPPRHMSAVASPDLLVGIDCAPNAATVQWNLRNQEFDNAMRDEIQALIDLLVAELDDE